MRAHAACQERRRRRRRAAAGRVVTSTPTGETRRHTFDFLVTMIDGTKIAIEVKPLSKVEKYHWRERLRRIAEQDEGFADRYVLVTEANLPPDAVYNAALLHARAPRRPSPNTMSRSGSSPPICTAA